MSLLNAWLTETDAIVTVDSDGVRDDGARLPSSKLLVIPHLNAVLAIRGQSAFLHFLFLRCASAGFDTFDEMCDALPDMIANMDASVPDELIAKNCRIGNELLVVGWSHRKMEMLGRQFVKRDEMTEYTDTEFSMHISPWDKSMPHIPKEPKLFQEIAIAQVDWMRSTFPNAACGGTLIMAHITKDSVTVKHKMQFPRVEH